MISRQGFIFAIALVLCAAFPVVVRAQTCIGPAVASGTGDAFAIGCLPPAPGIAAVIAPGPNTTINPTFAIPGQAPKVILRQDGTALQAGDIAGVTNALSLFADNAGHWRLLNPAMPAPTAALTVKQLYINPGTITIGAAGPANYALYSIPTLAGIATSSTVASLTAGPVQPAHLLYCADSVDGSYQSGGVYTDVACLAVQSIVGANSGKGARYTLDLNEAITAPITGGLAASQFYVVAQMTINSAYNVGGAPGSYVGNIYAFGGDAELYSGATYYNTVFGGELDFGIHSGASASLKAGLALVEVPGDAVNGTTVDAGLWLNSASGSQGILQRGIAFGDPSGHWPIGTGGTIIGTYGATGTVTAGLDFSAVTFTGNAISAGHFTVAGGGLVGSTNNLNGAYPTSANTSWAISDNFDGASGAVDIWNLQNTSNGGIALRQKTGASAQLLLAQFDTPNGTEIEEKLFNPNDDFVNLEFRRAAADGWLISERSGANAPLQVYHWTSGGGYALVMTLYNDGGIALGSPTGGDKGAGTINVSGGVYLNGTAYTNP